MGGAGSGNRQHSIAVNRLRRIDRAWENTEKILDGREAELKPFQRKASLEIALRTIPQKIEGAGFGTNIYSIVQHIQQDFISKNRSSPVELDSRDGLDTRRTRQDQSNQAISE